MNKQELIKRLDYLRYAETDDERYNYYNKGIDTAISFAKQLDEPEKPVVPQFVADWYEEHIGGDFEYNLYLLYVDYYEQKLEEDLKKWIGNGSKNKSIQTLVNMHQFGYEVEKEKLYTVKIANEDFGKMYIGIFKKFNKLGISSLPLNDDEVKSWFTEDELKRFKFWNNPAFEVKEVKNEKVL